MRTNSKNRLREACFANNLYWLRSFGCEVRREGEQIWILHPFDPDFRALLLTRPPSLGNERMARADLHAAIAKEMDVYVDTSVADSWEPALRASGLRQTAESVTRTVQLPSGRQIACAPFNIERVPTSNIDDWSAIYSRLFQRASAFQEIDRRRWRVGEAFPDVEHFVVRAPQTVVSVFQLCWHGGVVGLYSVGVGYANTIPLFKQIRAKAAELAADRQIDLLYFERTRANGRIGSEDTGPRTLRTFQVWRRRR